jgi:hypothetical protein
MSNTPDHLPDHSEEAFSVRFNKLFRTMCLYLRITTLTHVYVYIAVDKTSALGGRVRKFASGKFLQIFTYFEQFSLIIQNKISGVFLPMQLQTKSASLTGILV